MIAASAELQKCPAVYAASAASICSFVDVGRCMVGACRSCCVIVGALSSDAIIRPIVSHMNRVSVVSIIIYRVAWATIVVVRPVIRKEA